MSFFRRHPPAFRIDNTAFAQRSMQAARAEASALREQVNRYEAAQIGGTSRPYTPGWVRDARFDANQFTRWELTRKIRDAACNSWLVQRLWELYIRYSVGPAGLQVEPSTGTKTWDRAMADAYGEWCEQPCKDSLLTMAQVHRLEAGETHLDGEVFCHLTSRKPRGSRSLPALQLIESHRVGSGGLDINYYPPSAADSRVIDGVQLDSDSGARVTGYWVRDDFDGLERVYRPAYNPDRPIDGGMLHIYNPERIGMYRAISPYHSVLNELADLMLLDSLEMDRAKAASSIANILTTMTGEIPDAQKLIRDMAIGRLGIAGNDPAAAKKFEDLQSRIMQMQKILGARTVAIKPGEDIKQLAQSNPSAATQWYWLFKIGQICIANGQHMMLVMPQSIQGTVARALVDDANSYYRSQCNMFAYAAKAKYRFFADWARYNVPGLQDAPANWRACHVPPPREIGVDVGRDSVAKLAAYAAGVISLEDVVGPLGTTAERVTLRKAHNVAQIKLAAAQVSAETGVDVSPEEISAPLADVARVLAAANPQEPDEDDNEEPELQKQMEETNA